MKSRSLLPSLNGVHDNRLAVIHHLDSSHPVLLQSQARVSKAEHARGQKHKDALQDNKGSLFFDELAVVSVLQLSNTVGATGQDEQRCRRQAGEEGSEAPPKGGTAAGSQVAEHVVAKAGDEEDQDNDLQTETGQGDVDARLGGAGGVGGHGASGGLEGEADDVEGDEDVVEELGLEARQLWGEVDDGL